MKVLVTGGAGYVGFSVVRALAHSPSVSLVRVYDNLARGSHALFVNGKHGPATVEFRRGDILDGYTLDEVLDDIDVVVHLAAHATTPQSDRDHHVFDQVNNWGTSQLTRSIEAHDNVKTLLYLSSFAVYGDSDEPFDEASPVAPNSAYGISKLAGEGHISRLADSHRALILRAANVFGFNPAIRFDAAVNAMALAAWTERRIEIHGDGSQLRPFIDVDTLAAMIVRSIESDIDSGTYNLATHNASVNDIADVLATVVPNLERQTLHRDARMRRVSMALPTLLGDKLELAAPSFEASLSQLIATLAG